MAFLSNPQPLMLAKQRDFSETDAGDSLVQTRVSRRGADPQAARHAHGPSQGSQCRERIAPVRHLPGRQFGRDGHALPHHTDELLRITGVGSGKAAKYGAPFLALIAEHVEAEGIEKSEAMLVRSSAAKSKHKVAIIQLLDRKLGLTDIAAGIHGNRDMVLDEIEKIVGAGTKLNLDHILEESLDEECLEELFDFFSESEDDGLAAALEEFDDAYSEEELRLAKIKFMSEVAH